MAYDKGNRPEGGFKKKRRRYAEEKKFAYSVEKRITRSITRM